MFRFRLGTRADLPHCAALLPAGFRARAPDRRQLIGLWERLLAAESRCFAVFEDVERPYSDNIEGFGLSVFLAERFIDEFLAAPRPYLSALVYERLLAGDEVVANPAELRAANASTGLHSLALHHGMRNEDLADPRTASLLEISAAAFFFTHGGFRIASLIAEVYGPQQARYMVDGGFRQVRDFARDQPASFTDTPPAHHPHFFMLRREWVTPAPLHPLSRMFAPPPAPRIGFSTAERRVLERALLNEPDRRIAASLGVAPDSVKKTWRGIYDRTGSRAPFLLPAHDALASGSRGQEKRRHLLDYLRAHLEELRPSAPLPARGRAVVPRMDPGSRPG